MRTYFFNPEANFESNHGANYGALALLAILSLAAPFPTLAAHAQTSPGQTSPTQSDPDLPHHDWHTAWVSDPAAPLREPLVLHFRRALTLQAAPAGYIVRVSADNRFILYVNGRRVGDGPARGDLAHWRYELFNLAPYLHAGENLIAATVWNWGVYAPIAQISDRTAFLLESNATGADASSTPDGWQVEVDEGHRPLDRSTVDLEAYMAAGPGELIDAAHSFTAHTDRDWDSTAPEDPGGKWLPVASPMRDSIYGGVNQAHSADTTGDNNWGLVPDALPPMEYTPERAGEVVRIDTLGAVQPGLLRFPEAAATLAPGIHIHILLDRETLTTAYPVLTVSGGKGARIWVTYSEALYDKQMHKGDRDQVAGRTAHGLKDEFLPDGGDHRVFEPLWWRTWRYLDLDIATGSEPLTLESLTAAFTAYPFTEKARFDSGDDDLKKIWDISWRTARLDAHETYMDTPYYEQLQYIGDTRIQALISYAVAGDDRLARQALEAFNNSRIPEGITRSRYPSSLAQTIPTFSLLWIGMIHDWWMYRPDPEPARASLEGVRSVLHWFAGYEQPDGLLKQLPWWSFIDWVPSGAIPTYGANGESCMTTLEYLGALSDAADLEQGLGDSVFADRDRARARHVRAGLVAQCWDAPHGLLAETPDKNSFSQQGNILGVLYDVIPKDAQKALLRRMLAIAPGAVSGPGPGNILSASYYFRFYLARALDHAGMADDYLASLGPWHQLLPLHFSTWPEIPGDTRSDSHAWSAHPIYDLLTLVAGIQPASPGFKTVRIAPHLGALPALKASFPHPQGLIQVEYRRSAANFDATITLPGSLTGSFVYAGKTWPLHAGVNHIAAP
jgi:alpha-L-rhamnosidase